MAIKLIPCNKTITWSVRALHLIFNVFQWLHMKLHTVAKTQYFLSMLWNGISPSLQLSVFKKTRCISMPIALSFPYKGLLLYPLGWQWHGCSKNRREDEKEWGNLRHLAHWRKRGRRGWSREHHWEWGLKDRCPLGSTEHCFLYATLVTLFDDNSSSSSSS